MARRQVCKSLQRLDLLSGGETRDRTGDTTIFKSLPTDKPALAAFLKLRLLTAQRGGDHPRRVRQKGLQHRVPLGREAIDLPKAHRQWVNSSLRLAPNRSLATTVYGAGARFRANRDPCSGTCAEFSIEALDSHPRLAKCATCAREAWLYGQRLRPGEAVRGPAWRPRCL
mgnify:CR=1 FL=1